MSKYDAEFTGLSEYALLGRIRAIISGYQFTDSKRGRRAMIRVRAIEAMLYRDQEAMCEMPPEPLTRAVDAQDAPRCVVETPPLPPYQDTRKRPAEFSKPNSGMRRYVQLEMVLQ